MPAPESIDPEGQWRDLKAIGIATSGRIDGRGHHSLESRYYILSRVLSAAEFAEAVRGHWGIENSLHWQLDVSFREDDAGAAGSCAGEPEDNSTVCVGIAHARADCRRGIDTSG